MNNWIKLVSAIYYVYAGACEYLLVEMIEYYQMTAKCLDKVFLSVRVSYILFK